MNDNSGNARHTGFCGLMERARWFYVKGRKTLILRYVFNAYVTRKLS